MAWDDAPPKKEELAQASKSKSWTDTPPTKEELAGKPAQAEERPWYSVSGKGLVQGSLDAIPTVGAGVGGVAGLVGGIPGSIAGGAAGGAAGESLKQTLETLLLDEGPKTRSEQYGKLADAAKTGAMQEMGGQVVGKMGEAFAGSGLKDISKSLNRPSAEAIDKAAGALGVKATKGMKTDDYVVRNLENSLGQSPSVAGGLVRSEQEPIMDAIRAKSEGAINDMSHQSPYQAGKDIQGGIGKYFEDKYEPIKKSYGEIETQTKDIPINEKGVSRIANNIRNLDEAKFEGSDAHAIANKFAGWLENAENVNDIKLLKTKAGQILRDQSASTEAKSVAHSVLGKLEQAQTNTITRQAIQKARSEVPLKEVTSPEFAPKGSEAFPFLKPAQEAMENEATTMAQGAQDIASNKSSLLAAEKFGAETGRGLVSKIKDTGKQYKGLLQEAKTFGEGSGLTKANKGMAATLDDIKSSNPQDVASALFDTGNVNFTSFVKEKMPKEFEIARQQRLSEIAQKAQAPNGSLDSKKLTKIVEKLEPEARELLFGAKAVEDLGNVSTLLKSLPEKVGASDTPRGIQFQHLLNPVLQGGDLARYGLLKAKGSPAVIKGGGLLKKYAPVLGAEATQYMKER